MSLTHTWTSEVRDICGEAWGMWLVDCEAYLSNQPCIMLLVQMGLECWGMLQEEFDSTDGIVVCNPSDAPGQMPIKWCP